MKNLHYNQMVELLIANPDGLRVRNIARSIYNSEVSLFDMDAAVKFRRIHESVQRFLWQQSHKKYSPFERKGWGLYALKRHFVVQLELEFDDWEDDASLLDIRPIPKKNVAAEPMPDLFAGMW